MQINSQNTQKFNVYSTVIRQQMLYTAWTRSFAASHAQASIQVVPASAAHALLALISYPSLSPGFKTAGKPGNEAVTYLHQRQRPPSFQRRYPIRSLGHFLRFCPVHRPHQYHPTVQCMPSIAHVSAQSVRKMQNNNFRIRFTKLSSLK